MLQLMQYAANQTWRRTKTTWSDEEINWLLHLVLDYKAGKTVHVHQEIQTCKLPRSMKIGNNSHLQQRVLQNSANPAKIAMHAAAARLLIYL